MTNLFLLGGCWILAVGLAFHRIGDQSFWLDEAFSVAVAQRSLPEVWGIITSEQANMALYYLLLHWWLPLGQDEAAIRSLSALCTTLAVVPLWALGRQLADRWTASLAAVLFSTNAFLVARAAQEARGYGLTVLVTTSAAYLFVRAIDRDSTRAWAAILWRARSRCTRTTSLCGYCLRISSLAWRTRNAAARYC